MGTDIVVAETSVKFKKYFSMEGIYKLVKEWLVDEGFSGVTNRGDRSENYLERLYLEKETPAGKELVIHWYAEQIPFGSKYYKMKIEVKWHALTLKEAETVYKGKKVKINQGEIETIISAKIETDYLNKIKNHPVLGMFEKILRERLLKKKLEAMERTFYGDIMRLQGTLKSYLGLKLWAQAAEQIHPKMW